jgi:tetratricopeptide (TPR) repeat protein
LLFVDLETTGVGGGAGTYAFLIGCGWFEGAGFRVRQFFLASHAAERALLEAVADAAGASAAIVTYNGKTFDLPLMETRFLFHRLVPPFADVPHVDMLHPARHLWRQDRDDATGSCRLTAMEAALLGHVRDGDVPGFEIPSRYFHYVRTNDVRPLHAVFEHNRLDLLALAMLTARAAQLLEQGPAAARTAREALGLGRLYLKNDLMGQARAAFAKAADFGGAEELLTRAEALRAYAVLCRRCRDYDEAAAAWRRVLDFRCPPQIAREATEALAVHHEHRVRDLSAARRFALQSLELTISPARAQAVQYRLSRLDRKLAVPESPAALF